MDDTQESAAFLYGPGDFGMSFRMGEFYVRPSGNNIYTLVGAVLLPYRRQEDRRWKILAEMIRSGRVFYWFGYSRHDLYDASSITLSDNQDDEDKVGDPHRRYSFVSTRQPYSGVSRETAMMACAAWMRESEGQYADLLVLAEHVENKVVTRYADDPGRAAAWKAHANLLRYQVADRDARVKSLLAEAEAKKNEAQAALQRLQEEGL